MKFKRLFISVFLPIVVFMLCSFKETDDFFRYEINENNEVEIVSYVGGKFSGNVKVPEEIEGCKVTVIKESAFYNHQYVEGITIPSTVKIVEPSAFAYCNSLEKIVFEDGSEALEISEFAFEMCTSLKSLEFSNRDTYIDDYAFSGCLMLGRVYFPDNIKSIGYRAFSGCESIVFDCEENDLAKKYAEENNVPTKFTQTDDFLMIVILVCSVIILALIFIFYRILKNKKKLKRK